MSNPASVAAAYDRVAERYDGFYSGVACQAENLFIAHELDRWGMFNGPVLDLGCGTGLYLDLALLMGRRPNWYYGVDISEGMLGQARRKHGSYHNLSFSHSTMEQTLSNWELGCTIVSLFGVPGYTVDPSAFAASITRVLLPRGGQAFLMFHGRRRRGATILGREETATRYTARQVRQFYDSRYIRALYGVRAGPSWLPARRGASLLHAHSRTIGQLLPSLGQFIILVLRHP